MTKKKSVGRPKADKPMGILLALRVDKALVARLDRQLVQAKADTPHFAPTRSAIVRMLVVEALDAREKIKKPK